MVYYKSGTGLTINLYTKSNAEFKLADGSTVQISQETDYPNSGEIDIEIKISESAKFPLSLRIPRWCRKAEVLINGTPVKETIDPGSFFTIDRKWESGDKVQLNMPMELRLVKGKVANIMKVAVMRGPVLFCLNPSFGHSGRSAIEQFTAIGSDGLVGLNINTFKGPINDQTVRPDGMAVKVSTCGNYWLGKSTQGHVMPVELLLTEFPDPNGQLTFLPMNGLYFKGKNYGDKNVKHIDMIVDDELIDLY